MVVFRKRKIVTVKSLGEELRKARRMVKLTLGAVEKRIKVAQKYLQAIENGEWEVLPGEVYAKNWLKKYASFLGLSWGEMKKKFNEEIGRQKIWSEGDKYRFGVAKKRLVVLPRVLKNLGIAVVILVVVGYLGWQVWSLLAPPKLEILYPQENYVSSGKAVKILGKVEEGAWLGLNEKEISADDEGWFLVDIDLNSGLNVIKIEARKSYGRSRVEYLRIVTRE